MFRPPIRPPIKNHNHDLIGFRAARVRTAGRRTPTLTPTPRRTPAAGRRPTTDDHDGSCSCSSCSRARGPRARPAHPAPISACSHAARRAHNPTARPTAPRDRLRRRHRRGARSPLRAALSADRLRAGHPAPARGHGSPFERRRRVRRWHGDRRRTAAIRAAGAAAAPRRRPQAEGAEPLPGMHSGRSVGPGCATLPRRRSERACAGVLLQPPQRGRRGMRGGRCDGGRLRRGRGGRGGGGGGGGWGGAQQPRWAAAEQRELGWP